MKKPTHKKTQLTSYAAIFLSFRNDIQASNLVPPIAS
jgi:hypothetical protein